LNNKKEENKVIFVFVFGLGLPKRVDFPFCLYPKIPPHLTPCKNETGRGEQEVAPTTN